MGDWVTGFTCKVRVKNALHAESLALLHGLNLAKSKNMKCLMVETDSQLLQMECQLLKHIPREANRVADILAVHGRKSMDPDIDRNQPYIFDASPSFVTKELDRDTMGTVTYRLVPD
ncbi:hypothetical protein R3W88_015464 [Solanum pinnatisectum]|uniref:RNase H type-1 domain-containing protein n=1 Tax=Solanum pinnatisectum TaxID=50273 RepID=A0AAV9KV15_9SOLN|nr:hypothetical protein R3W88_015464 [Solanum pinnatisectum]